MAKTVEPRRSAGKSIVSLKVTLRGTRPPVWRRLLMPDEMTLGDLHQAIQATMGWHDEHLHAFGDNWEHTVVIEKRALPSEATFYPACVGGKRNCPPEDCGGAWGYQHLLDILADPAHPERAEQIEWVGEEFDPDEFAIEIADAAIAARFRRK